ncbi:MAG: hypothetical protein AVDCRST_MAG93-7242, partial [uncultured Chloroflexia bacterium]
HVTFRYNVIHNVPKWLHLWTSSIQNNTVTHNYSDTSAMTNNGTNNTISNTTVVSDGVWPTEAQNIMNEAGIE